MVFHIKIQVTFVLFLEKDEKLINIYFPYDVNTTMEVSKKLFDTYNCLNVLVCGKKESYQISNLDEAKKIMKNGIGKIKKYSDKNPNIIFCVCGNYNLVEVICAIKILKKLNKKIKIKLIYILKLNSKYIGNIKTSNQKKMEDLFTKDKPVIFSFHGYPNSLKKVLFDYKKNYRFDIFGYEENGSTTSPQDMEIRNHTSRFQLVIFALKKLYEKKVISKSFRDKNIFNYKEEIKKHHKYIIKNGDDPKIIYDWL